RPVTRVAALALCLALPLPILAPNVPLLVLSLVFLGACNSTLDVSMNAQAVLVEQAWERPIMSSLHGLFSLGGLAGAGLAAGVMALGVARTPHAVGTPPPPPLALLA